MDEIIETVVLDVINELCGRSVEYYYEVIRPEFLAGSEEDEEVLQIVEVLDEVVSLGEF